MKNTQQQVIKCKAVTRWSNVVILVCFVCQVQQLISTVAIGYFISA